MLTNVLCCQIPAVDYKTWRLQWNVAKFIHFSKKKYSGNNVYC